jgi:hypothetical protein
MSENDKNVEQKNDKNNKGNNGFDMNYLLRLFIACFVVSLIFNLLAMGGLSNSSTRSQSILTNEFIATLAESPYASVSEKTTLRCVNYNPIFTEDGTKQYDVRFKDMNSDLFLNVVIPASEIDELGNVEKDAKYEATINYMYVENAFQNIVKDMEDSEKEKRILGLLDGESEYAKFGLISDISFMYSKYMDEYSTEKATEYLDGYVDKLVNPPVEETTNKKIPFLGLTSK